MRETHFEANVKKL